MKISKRRDTFSARSHVHLSHVPHGTALEDNLKTATGAKCVTKPKKKGEEKPSTQINQVTKEVNKTPLTGYSMLN